MDIFDIIVGVFSIIGSVSAIVSAVALININSKTSVKGNNNDTKVTVQTNRGKNNSNNS